jgi:signal peptidase I
MATDPDSPRHTLGVPRALIDYGLTAVAAVVLAVLIQAFVVKPYMIPSTSMATTLVPGQRVLVDRVSYRFRAIQRGDIVVFHRPDDTKDILIKRVVGLPGDVLSIADGHLRLNGVPLNEPYVDRVGGVPEQTQPADASSPDGSPPWSLERPFTVPAGTYFVMGDNRVDSLDSRYWGTVPRGDVIGRAFVTYWPLTRVGGL